MADPYDRGGWLPAETGPRTRREAERANREAIRTGRGLISLDVPPPVPSRRDPAEPPEDYDG